MADKKTVLCLCGGVLTAVLDARLERTARERRGAALDDARLQPHLQHVGLRRCRAHTHAVTLATHAPRTQHARARQRDQLDTKHCLTKLNSLRKTVRRGIRRGHIHLANAVYSLLSI
ncbi:jg26230 [Pararge aegeria aegeria]|uniref:Jg26230 protein n=1 Tax=Pararge aegeria aegeria TaxID=348720 RepID=A0A8S4QIX1_9NEOP|nr:jg26230 [Pararge aegeria aegeria]